MAVPYGPYQPFLRNAPWTAEEAAGAVQKDKVLEMGPSSSNPDYFSHRGPKWAELGHLKEVGLGLTNFA